MREYEIRFHSSCRVSIASILLNGRPRQRFFMPEAFGRGTTIPNALVLVMEVLNTLILQVNQEGLF